MKSESQIIMLIRETEAEIKKIRPTIKSMGSPEARALARLEGKIEAFKEILKNEKKEYVDISGGARGSHTIAPDHDSITSSSVDITSSE
jgi:hypothetical protein